MSRTLFFLAGEASGDLHGGKLVAALKALDPSVRCVGMGGPQMAAAGLEVFKDLDGMQVVGFWEVAKRYGFFKQVFYQLLDRVKQEKPDALICIDYPGFNLRFAKEVKKLGIPCLYYIVPQVWAWKPKRAAKMAEFIDRAYCVFEFEPPFFDKFKSPQRAMKTEFVGHPILDCRFKISDFGLADLDGLKLVSFLPGSRLAEYVQHFYPLLGAYKSVSAKLSIGGCFFSIPNGISEISPELVSINAMGYEAHLGGYYGITKGEYEYEMSVRKTPKPHFVIGDKGCIAGGPEEFLSKRMDKLKVLADTHIAHSSLLPALSDFSVVKSGTSTLEAGLQGNPMCVVYRGGWVSYSIARMLVDIPVFSLVNIVLGKYAVPELLQSEVNPQRIAAEIERGLTDQKYIEQQRAALAELPKKLGGPGASKRAAERMLAFLDGRD
ncbi:MAG: hypothetical protein HS116_14655 [Planctomycetes bacterium]|nr:hypothetical protein [Planctomycetota bacterium]